MLLRLQNRKSNYNYEKWEQEEVQRQELLKRVSHLPKKQGGQGVGKFDCCDPRQQGLYPECLLDQPLLGPAILRDQRTSPCQRTSVQLEERRRRRKSVHFDSLGGLSTDQLTKGASFGHEGPQDLEPARIVVYKRGLEIEDASYICEIAYNRRGFFISLFSVQHPGRCTMLHLKNCERTEQILSWFNNDFDAMARAIKLREGRIRISKHQDHVRKEEPGAGLSTIGQGSLMKNQRPDQRSSAAASLNPDRSPQAINGRRLSPRARPEVSLSSTLKKNLLILNGRENQQDDSLYLPYHSSSNTRSYMDSLPGSIHDNQSRSQSEFLLKRHQRKARPSLPNKGGHGTIARPAADTIQYEYMSHQNSKRASPLLLARRAPPMLGLAAAGKARKFPHDAYQLDVNTGGNGAMASAATTTGWDRKGKLQSINSVPEYAEGYDAKSSKLMKAQNQERHAQSLVFPDKAVRQVGNINVKMLGRTENVGDQAEDNSAAGQRKMQNRSCLTVLSNTKAGKGKHQAPKPIAHQDAAASQTAAYLQESIDCLQSGINRLKRDQEQEASQSTREYKEAENPRDRSSLEAGLAGRQEDVAASDHCPGQPRFVDGVSSSNENLTEGNGVKENSSRAQIVDISNYDKENAYGDIGGDYEGIQPRKGGGSQHRPGHHQRENFHGYRSQQLVSVEQTDSTKALPRRHLEKRYANSPMPMDQHQNTTIEHRTSPHLGSFDVRMTKSGGIKIQHLIEQQQMMNVRYEVQDARGDPEDPRMHDADEYHGAEYWQDQSGRRNEFHNEYEQEFEFPKKKIYRKNENVFQRLSKPKRRASTNPEDAGHGQRRALASKAKGQNSNENHSKQRRMGYNNKASIPANKENNARNSSLASDFGSGGSGQREDGQAYVRQPAAQHTGSLNSHENGYAEDYRAFPPGEIVDNQDDSEWKQATEHHLNYARLAGSPEKLFIREKQRALAAKEKMKTSHMKKRIGASFKERQHHARASKTGMPGPAPEATTPIESSGPEDYDQRADGTDEDPDERSSTSGRLVPDSRIAGNNEQVQALNAHPKKARPEDRSYHNPPNQRPSHESRGDTEINMAMLDEQYNKSQQNSQHVEISNISYYGGAHDGFAKTVSGLGHHDPRVGPNFNASHGSRSQKSIKMLSNVKHTVPPPSMLEEIKKEVSEYSQSQKTFLLQQKPTIKHPSNGDQVEQRRFRARNAEPNLTSSNVGSAQISEDVLNERSPVRSPEEMGPEAEEGPRETGWSYNMNKTDQFAVEPGVRTAKNAALQQAEPHLREDHDEDRMDEDEIDEDQISQLEGNSDNYEDSDEDDDDPHDDEEEGVSSQDVQQHNDQHRLGGDAVIEQEVNMLNTRPAQQRQVSSTPDSSDILKGDSNAPSDSQQQVDSASMNPATRLVEEELQRQSREPDAPYESTDDEGRWQPSDPSRQSASDRQDDPAAVRMGNDGVGEPSTFLNTPEAESESAQNKQASSAASQQVSTKGEMRESPQDSDHRQQNSEDSQNGPARNPFTEQSPQKKAKKAAPKGDEVKEAATKQSQLSSIPLFDGPEELLAGRMVFGVRASHERPFGGRDGFSRQDELFPERAEQPAPDSFEERRGIPEQFGKIAGGDEAHIVSEQVSFSQSPTNGAAIGEATQPFQSLYSAYSPPNADVLASKLPAGQQVHQRSLQVLGSGPGAPGAALAGGDPSTLIGESGLGSRKASQQRSQTIQNSERQMLSAVAKANSSLDISEFSFRDKSKGNPAIQLRFRSSNNADGGRDQPASMRNQEPQALVGGHDETEGIPPPEYHADSDSADKAGSSSRLLNARMMGLDTKQYKQFQSGRSNERNQFISAIMERTFEQSAGQTEKSKDENTPGLKGALDEARSDVQSLPTEERDLPDNLPAIILSDKEINVIGEQMRKQPQQAAPSRPQKQQRARQGARRSGPTAEGDPREPVEEYSDLPGSRPPCINTELSLTQAQASDSGSKHRERTRMHQHQVVERAFEDFMKDDDDLLEDADYKAMLASMAEQAEENSNQAASQSADSLHSRSRQGQEEGIPSTNARRHSDLYTPSTAEKGEEPRARAQTDHHSRGAGTHAANQEEGIERRGASGNTGVKNQLEPPSSEGSMTEDQKKVPAVQAKPRTGNQKKRMIRNKLTPMNPSSTGKKEAMDSTLGKSHNESSEQNPHILAQIQHMDDMTSFEDDNSSVDMYGSHKFPALADGERDELGPAGSSAAKTAQQRYYEEDADESEESDQSGTDRSEEYSWDFDEDQVQKPLSDNSRKQQVRGFEKQTRKPKQDQIKGKNRQQEPEPNSGQGVSASSLGEGAQPSGSAFEDPDLPERTSSDHHRFTSENL